MRAASANTPPVTVRKRCAIYTRKSTDEGLEQEYNSLEAQRDAGTAYVASQRHEGWILSVDGYDDGGYSGGNMERPALKRLMHDIECGLVDIVVVYKIDRLTRSLADFAKLVEVFDRHNVSFVSVTQQFNTTTSMGRLTLNILLSFAQFEREVTSERIRDKFAASKAKGMWMGGVPPLGYDVVNRKLVVNETEASLVRHIFSRYAEHGSPATIVRELEIEGRTTKAWQTQEGRVREGRTIDQRYLFYMLRNRLYLGEMPHKGDVFPGEHTPIIERALWDEVHALIARRRQAPREGRRKYPALLAGLLFAADGQRLMHQAKRTKHGRLYRYYVPYLFKRRAAGTTLDASTMSVGTLPAAEIEAAVLEQVHQALQKPEIAIGTWLAAQRHAEGAALEEPAVVLNMQRIGSVWPQLFPAEQQRIVQLLIERVQVASNGLDIHWRERAWRNFDREIAQHPLIAELQEGAEVDDR